MFILGGYTLLGQFRGGGGGGYYSWHLKVTSSMYRGSTNDGFISRNFISPNQIYRGGNYDGSASLVFPSPSPMYRGGYYDGYASCLFDSPGMMYLGGYYDGYASLGFIPPGYMFMGGYYDGYASLRFSPPSYMFAGGYYDGYASLQFKSPASFFRGGYYDGYASIQFEPSIQTPLRIQTLAVSGIQSQLATCGGVITSDGGESITQRGIVWSLNENPTIEDNMGMTIDGTGTGTFASNMTELQKEVIYHVRAYAMNSSNIAYGEDVYFFSGDYTPPTAICKNLELELDEDGSRTLTPEEVDDGSHDNSGIKSLALDRTEFSRDDIGEHIVTLTVTDNYDNTSSCQSTVIIRLGVDSLLFAWGNNSWYQLGLGNTWSPGQVGDESAWEKVSCGSDHTIAIKSDGTLWAWGKNYNGQLGIGNKTDQHNPVQVGSDNNWTEISCGYIHVIALKSDGTLWAWGYNTYGVLGIGNTTNQLSPVQVGTDTDWSRIFCGNYHVTAIKSDGTLWAWGYNSYGQLGIGNSTNQYSPVQVGSDTDWSNAACGYAHSMAIKSNGTLWAWGMNIRGQLGTGNTSNHLSPVQIEESEDWQTISCGDWYTMAIRTDGTLWGWGNSYSGQLGTGNTDGQLSPVQINSNTDWSRIFCHYSHSNAIKSDGTLWTWGYNRYGQLGIGNTTNQYSPVQVGEDTNWSIVALGVSHTSALKSDGTLWAWGSDSYGQLGIGNTNQYNSPEVVGNDNDWSEIICGMKFFTMGIKSDGSLWAWGDNQYGQLGIGNTITQTIPIQVEVDYDWTQVSCGEWHTMGIKTDGTLWAWGNNNSGYLGIGNTIQQTSPVKVGEGGDWSQIQCGSLYTMGIKTDGTLWAWGSNSSGQLGIGNTIDQLSPVQVGSDTDWSKVFCGWDHSIAIKGDGSLWAWGRNVYGQLGIGNTISQLIPVRVGSDSDWSKVTCGNIYNLALKTNGTLWAWGANHYGQLGIGNTTNQFAPIQVGSDSDWSRIACGTEHSLAIKTDGTLLTWGSNRNGQLGNGTINNESSPITIGTATDWSSVSAGDKHSVGLRIKQYTPPYVACNDLTITLDQNGTASITAEDIDNGSTDSDGIKSMELDKSEFTCEDIGENIVTLTVTDNNDNSASCEATVTVISPMVVKTGYVRPGALDVAYESDKFIAAGGTKPYTYAATGLPAGLGMSSGGIISGTPSESGKFIISVTANDANGCYVTRDVKLNILESPCFSLYYPDHETIQTGGDQATFIEAFDINNDGNLDFVVASRKSNDISILLGDGLGNFETPIVYPVGTLPSAIAIEDFNDDGDKDLAVCNGGSGSITVLIGNGDGTFETGDIYSGLSAPKTISTADFNGDDNLDLLLPNTTSDNATILFGNGDGSFGDILNINAGDMPWAAETGDFDEDGNEDFVVTNSADNNLYLNLSDGSGGFNSPVLISTGLAPRHVAVSDLDEDGHLDLVIANWSDDSFSILYGDGTGSFDDPVNYPVGDEPYNVMIDDLNSDGHKDIAVANYSSHTISVYHGTCDKNFVNRVDYSSTLFPRWLSSGDFNDDGKIDMLAATRFVNIVNLMLNNCRHEPIARCKLATVALQGSEVIITPEDIDNGSTGDCDNVTKEVIPNTFNCDNLGEHPVELKVTDSYGNTSSCLSLVTIIDDTDPELITPESSTLIAEPGQCSIAVDFEAIATDNCYATVTYSHMPGSVFPVGTTTVTCTAKDPSGNIIESFFNITVEDKEIPSIDCPGRITVNALPGLCHAIAVDLGVPEVNDNCGIQKVLNDAPAEYPVGDNIVTWTVWDVNGNANYCEQIVTVLDDEDPIAKCKDIIAEIGESGYATIAGSDINDGSIDNCSIQLLEASPNTFDYKDIGIVSVRLEVKDNSGNKNNCYSNVTIQDNIPPVARCKNTSVYLDGKGEGSIRASDIDDNSTDNARIRTMSVSPSMFYCADIGANTITLTVEDYGDNTSTCTSTVNVIDDRPPRARCNDIIIFLNADGTASITADQIDDNSSDNCGISSMSVEPDTFDESDIGRNTVTLTVYDNSGNYDQCNSDVTVREYQGKKGEYDYAITGFKPVKLKVYPNPTNDKITIELYMLTEMNIEISIANLLGGELINFEAGVIRNLAKSFDMKDYPAGVYIIKIKAGNEIIYRKFIKE